MVPTFFMDMFFCYVYVIPFTLLLIYIGVRVTRGNDRYTATVNNLNFMCQLHTSEFSALT